MKKCWIISLSLLLLLSGCGAAETMETVSDEMAAPVMAQPKQIYVELPGEAASPAVESDSGRLYLCGDYEISVQILDGGDLESTVRTLTGYEKDTLTVMETMRNELNCYEFVWYSAGETGDRVGQATILDDGSFHYCLSVLGDAEKAPGHQVFWDQMFQSFRLA